jgi:uncharacterized protein (TIGR00369 family)
VLVDLRALVDEARRSGDLEPLSQAIPAARFLGISAGRDQKGLVTRMRFQPHIIGNAMLPAIHGGALGALLESAAVFELLMSAQTHHVPKIISLTIEYLRSAKAVDTVARGEVVHHGRRVATVRVLGWQEDPARPVVAANAHFLLAEGG